MASWYEVFFCSMHLFFFNDTATTEIYTSIDTLSLHDALPIWLQARSLPELRQMWLRGLESKERSEEHTSELQSPIDISYAVFCLKKKNREREVGRRGRRRGTGEGEHRFVKRVAAGRARQFFFFNDTATPEIYTSIVTLSLHDALPISSPRRTSGAACPGSTRRAPHDPGH